MKTKHYILMSGLLMALSVHGQEAWTLDRRIAYAREHATEVRRQTLEQEQKRADYRTSVARLPALGVGGGQRTVQLGPQHRPGDQHL